MTEVRRERLTQSNRRRKIDEMLFNPICFVLKVELKRFPDRLYMDGRTRSVEMTPKPLTLVSGRTVLPSVRWTGKRGSSLVGLKQLKYSFEHVDF